MESIARADKDALSGNAQSPSGKDSAAEAAPSRLPSKFHACVRSRENAERVRKELGRYNTRLTIHETEVLTAVKQGNVILLCCEPHVVREILRVNGMREALAGKLLISICSGVTEDHIHDILYSECSEHFQKCTIVRAMPNIAASIRESMTVIATSPTPLPEDTERLITWIFTQIGSVRRVPSSAMDVCTALCGSGPAFAALMVESMAAGAVSMGLPREDAYAMAAQAVRGSAGILLQGEHPAVLRDRVSTPGGATIGGLLVLEEAGLKGTMAKAVREAATIAGRQGSER